MRGKLSFKSIFLILCFVGVINAWFTVDDYLLKLVRVFISVSFIVIFMMLIRNIKMTNWLFKNRFYWFYPLISLFGLSFYVIMITLFNAEIPTINKVLGVILIALTIGFFWGLIERFREHKYLSNSTLSETLDLVTDDLDTINRGVLIKNEDSNFYFKKKGETIFEFDITNIKSVNIIKEYKIFPLMLKVELNNGEKYDFESQFPFVWKKLLKS